MRWTLKYLPDAAKDFKNLAGNQRIIVAKAIDKVLENPLGERNSPGDFCAVVIFLWVLLKLCNV